MLQKTKLYAGITLFVQSFSFLAMFIMLFRKRTGFANVFLAIAAVSGAVGAALLYLDSKDELKRRRIITARDTCCSTCREDISGGFGSKHRSVKEADVIRF